MEHLVDVQEAAWPLVVVRIPPVLDVRAIESMYQGFDRMVTRRTKFTALVDTSALRTFPQAVERKLIAEGRASRVMTEAAFNLGNAVFLTSAAARLVLRLIEWVRPPVVPQYLVPTFAEGVEWCCGRLARAHIPLTPEIEALRRDAQLAEGRAP